MVLGEFFGYLIVDGRSKSLHSGSGNFCSVAPCDRLPSKDVRVIRPSEWPFGSGHKRPKKRERKREREGRESEIPLLPLAERRDWFPFFGNCWGTEQGVRAGMAQAGHS